MENIATRDHYIKVITPEDKDSLGAGVWAVGHKGEVMLVCKTPFTVKASGKGREVILTYWQGQTPTECSLIATERFVKDFYPRLLNELAALGIRPEPKKIQAFKNLIYTLVDKTGLMDNSRFVHKKLLKRVIGNTMTCIDQFLMDFSSKKMTSESIRRHMKKYTIDQSTREEL